jgi:hypothetical protein
MFLSRLRPKQVPARASSTISKRGALLETGAGNLPMHLQHERIAAFSNNSLFGPQTKRPTRRRQWGPSDLEPDLLD